MIKEIKTKIKKGWNWCKRKIREIAIALGIIGVVLAAGNVLTPDKIPFVEVNGQRIEFPYTDDNSNENLIIRTDKMTYGGWNNADVYIMVENKSGIGQVVNLQTFFSDESKSVADISRLKTNVSYEIDVPDYQTIDYDCSTTTISTTTEETKIEKKTCQRKEQVGSYKETRYRDEWQLQELSEFSQHENNLLIINKEIPEKDKKGFEAKKKIQTPILNNEITYFKIKIEFPLKTKDEFFIEAIGSEAGYGILDPWYDSNWTYRKQITIDPDKIDDVLTNFPVMIKFSSSTFDFTHAKGDGTDFIFTDSSGTTTIDFERERYASTTDGAVFWVEVPSVASTTPSTTIYMYYGNTAASDAASSTAVWDANFMMVHHLAGASTTTLDDSTSYHNDVTGEGGTPIYNSDAKIGKGVYYDGVNEYDGMADTDSMSGYEAATWEVLFYGEALAGDEPLISKNNYPPTFEWHIGVNNYLFGWLASKDGGVVNWTGDLRKVTVENNTWYFGAVTWNGTTWRIYTNGVEGATGTWAGGPIYNGTLLPRIASIQAAPGQPNYFQGKIDETRISNIARSAAWIKASYNSGNNSLLTYGGEESEAITVVIPQMEVIIIGG